MPTKTKTKRPARQSSELPEERSARRLRARVEAAGLRNVLKTYKAVETGGYRATYRGAAPTRLDSTWATGGYIGNRQKNRNLRDSFRQMRDRARQLEQDNVLAGAVLDRAVENVIGTGIRVKPTSSSPEFNAAVAKSWKRWTTGKTADIRHYHTFGALQRLAYRAKLRDGDAGVLLTEEEDLQGRKHPRLQIIEGEHIDNALGGGNLGNVIDGVELDDNNAAVAFHLVVENDRGGTRTEPIRGRDFVFLCRPPLYSSVRGESAFNGGWVLFDQIVGYLESVVVASRVAASQALLITKNNAAQTVNNLPQLVGASGTAGEIQKSFGVEPGMAHFLAPGEDVKGFNPTQPQQQMESAINTFCRFVGLRFGLTIEQVLLNFALTSYSSGRAARLQADQTATMEQEDFASTFLSRVYPWAVAKWLKAGLLTVPPPQDGTAYSFEWIPQGKPWVDPTKEILAAKQAIDLGLDARSLIAAERGYDFAELCQINEHDIKTLAQRGLPTTTDGVPLNPVEVPSEVMSKPQPALPAPTPQPPSNVNG